MTSDVPAALDAPASFFRSMMGGLQSVLLLLLVVLLFPLAILVIGAPIALVLRAALSLAGLL